MRFKQTRGLNILGIRSKMNCSYLEAHLDSSEK